MKTLRHAERFELEVKNSRFLVHAAPVDTPATALEFVAQVSLADATHNCWAYRIGSAYRSSDDGEPAGTAGRPILQAIDGHQIDGVVAVVTRFFGGTKLGAGGLARAYGGSVAECLRRADKIDIIQLSKILISCDFTALGSVHLLLATYHAKKLDERFDADGGQLTVELPAAAVDSFRSALLDATRGKARLHEAG